MRLILYFLQVQYDAHIVLFISTILNHIVLLNSTISGNIVLFERHIILLKSTI